jgi:hypothetical protein
MVRSYINERPTPTTTKSEDAGKAEQLKHNGQRHGAEQPPSLVSSHLHLHLHKESHSHPVNHNQCIDSKMTSCPSSEGPTSIPNPNPHPHQPLLSHQQPKKSASFPLQSEQSSVKTCFL